MVAAQNPYANLVFRLFPFGIESRFTNRIISLCYEANGASPKDLVCIEAYCSSVYTDAIFFHRYFVTHPTYLGITITLIKGRKGKLLQGHIFSRVSPPTGG